MSSFLFRPSLKHVYSCRHRRQCHHRRCRRLFCFWQHLPRKRAQGLQPSTLITRRPDGRSCSWSDIFFRSHTLRLLQRGKVVFLWGAVPIVFGIGIGCVCANVSMCGMCMRRRRRRRRRHRHRCRRRRRQQQREPPQWQQRPPKKEKNSFGACGSFFYTK
jgi:hypothetical protein